MIKTCLNCANCDKNGCKVHNLSTFVVSCSIEPCKDWQRDNVPSGKELEVVSSKYAILQMEKRGETNMNKWRFDGYDIAEAFEMGAAWQHASIWHDKSEIPRYEEDDIYGNQILLYGEVSIGVGFSVCAMIDAGVVYSPVSKKEYNWADVHAEKWAYVSDLSPKGSEYGNS